MLSQQQLSNLVIHVRNEGWSRTEMEHKLPTEIPEEHWNQWKLDTIWDLVNGREPRKP